MRGIAGGSLSGAPNGQIIDFERAELRHVPSQDALHLWVRGTLPGTQFEARLAPRYYLGTPDYWGIEVAAVQLSRPAHDDALADHGELSFERSVPLVGITGNRGIMVIGANRSQRIEIDDGSI